MKEQIDILLTECAQRRRERGQSAGGGAKKRGPATSTPHVPPGVANSVGRV